MALVRLQGPNEIAPVWKAARELILSSLNGTEITEKDLLDSVLADIHQMWVDFEGSDIKAVGFTQLVNFSQGKMCEVVAAAAEGGQLDNMLEHLEEMSLWARGQGCTYMQIWGRKGWEKVLSEDWKATRVLFLRDLHE